MEDILGMFGSMGESDDIPTIIDNFAKFLMELLAIITNLLKGDFSAITGSTEPASQA